jgi:predicted nucleic acid-binding Zn ribbon protein
MRNKKCLYCGKLLTEGKPYCSIQCKDKYEKFEKTASKRTVLFGVTIAIMIVMMFVGMTLSVVNPKIGIPVSLLTAAGLFITFIVLPFATPQTVELIGLKKSILIVRLLASVMLLWITIHFIRYILN